MIPHALHERKAETVLLCVILLLLGLGFAQGDAAILLTHDEYQVGEQVAIGVAGVSDDAIRLWIESPAGVSNYVGFLEKDVSYTPLLPGTHTIVLADPASHQIITTRSFLAHEATGAPAPSITANQAQYREGELVVLSFNEALDQAYELHIYFESEEYQYLGALDEHISFRPPHPGMYAIVLSDEKGDRVAELSVTVQPAGKANEQASAEKDATQPPSQTQKGINYAQEGSPSPGTLITINGIPDTEGVPGRHDLAISLQGTGELEFHGFDTTDVNRIHVYPRVGRGLSELSTDGVSEFVHLELSEVTFDKGNLVRRAKGTALWSCAAWNESTSSCLAEWTKTADISPGQQYTMPISAGSTALMETGIATVNTDKPAYLPGQFATVWIAVLDSAGYLFTEADVSLTVTTPNGTIRTFTTESDAIHEIKTGIYAVSFEDTLAEGMYQLHVEAESEGVTQSMDSFFLVNASLEFDVVREAPLSIDPRMPFISTITITPLSGAGAYNFTEILPRDFAIIDAGGATVFADGAEIFLTWTGLEGQATVSYRADAPDVIPGIAALGPSFIRRTDEVFEEARPWYLALDPSVSFVGDEAEDVSIVPIDNTTLAILWGDEAGNDVYFAVYDTTGTLLAGPATVRSNVGEQTRVALGALNASHFALSWLLLDTGNNQDDVERAVYDVNANQVVGQADVDGNIGGTGASDVAIAALDDRFMVCYVNEGDDDADFRGIDPAGSEIVGEANVDGNMGGNQIHHNLLDCKAIDGSQWVYTWFDDNDGDAVLYEVIDETGATVSGDNVQVDSDGGANAEVAVAALNGSVLAFAWQDDGNNDILLTMRELDDTQVLAETQVDGNAGDQARIAVAAVRGAYDSSDSVVLVWNDLNSATIQAAVYDITGAQVTAPFTVDSAPDSSFTLLDVAGKDPGSGNEICPGHFVVAYTNSSDRGVFRGFSIDGSSWNGTCNLPPSTGNPLITSEGGSNTTDAQIYCTNQSTADPEQDSVKNIIVWRVNNVSSALLNTPFEGGSNTTFTKDYSGYGRHGNGTNGPVWNGTAGYDGRGAYIFNGSTYIAVPSFPNVQNNFTITAWVMSTNVSRTGQRIFADDETNSGGYALSLGDPGSGALRFFSRNKTTISLDTAGGLLQNNRWHFVAAAADVSGQARRIYVDGVLAATLSPDTGTWGVDTGIAAIGGETNAGESANRFVGKIDELVVWNRTLSESQIQALYQNRTNTTMPSETITGESWLCQMTPNDGMQDGFTRNSTQLLVLVAIYGPTVANLTPANNSLLGVGENITITANVTGQYNVSTVLANVTLPNGSNVYPIMTSQGSGRYSAVFRTWAHGLHYFGVWANDTTGNATFADPFFWIAGNASVTIKTEEGDYSSSELVRLTDSAVSASWWNSSFAYRVNATISETQGLARTSTHTILNFTIPVGTLPLANENKTVLVCEGTRVPWDAYATTVSAGSITALRGLAELNVSGGETLDCAVYYDATVGIAEVLPSSTGWGYVGASGYTGGNVVDLAPADLDCSGTDADGQFTSICSASDNIKLNEWCYFKAPSTTASLILKTGSDDGSALWINNTIAVADNDGPHGVQWRDNSCAGCSGALTVVQDKYYLLEIGFAENAGGEELSNRWDTSAGDNTNGNVIDTECYPTHGDEWALTVQTFSAEQSPSQIRDGGATNISGYVFLALFKNVSGVSVLVDTILNDSASGTLRSLAPGSIINLATLWNADPWNTSLGSAGTYAAYAAFTDDAGNVLTNDNGTTMNSTYSFTVENELPVVTAIQLLPLLPSDSQDLNCSFTISDPNTVDSLTANVTWFLNSTSMLTTTVAVTNGVERNVSLAASNTSVGDMWMCGVTPYDGISRGAQSNSSSRTIVATLPPVFSAVQCERNGASWIACSALQFADTLTGVRAACADPDGFGIMNATFSLWNADDDRTFFTDTTTDTSTYSGYFFLNNADVTIADSGTFNFSATCTDMNATSATNTTTWFIPFGSRTVTLLTPTENTNVTQYRTFNFSVRIACAGGECDSYNATLDPPDPWDVPTFHYRVPVNMSEPQSLTRTNEHVRIRINISTGVLPTINENGTVLYCNSTRIRWDAYARNTSSSWITQLEGLAELNFSAGETKSCFVYYDSSATIAESPPVTTGWGYACDNNYNVCGTPGSVTPANADATGTISDLTINPITCNGDTTTFTSTFYCYFKAPDAGLQTLGIASDDGSILTVESTTVVNNAYCQGTFCRDGGYTFSAGQYYEMVAAYDQSGGGADLYAYYNPTTCGASGDGAGNTIGNECYPFMGGSWSINTSAGTQESTKQGPVSTTPGAVPFYTTDSNPRLPSELVCLANMTSGDSCDVSWSVNATGPLLSVHPFFVEITPWYYTPYTGPNYSATVNITIIGNALPTVTAITLLPTYPTDSDNLNCTFTISDVNNGDTLSANVTWFRNGASFNSSLASVSSGVSTTVLLNASSTTLGDTWFCRAVPMDSAGSGTSMNSSTVTILANRPPTVNAIQCQEQGSTWAACSNVAFGDNLTGVRVNCTDVDGIVQNASFVLRNEPDNHTLFSGASTDTTTYTGYVYFNNNDTVIADSGTFNMTVSCTDNNASASTNATTWIIPWGALHATLIDPAASTNVQKDQFFNFTTQITCTGGECGSANATLDPNQWHNASFQYRIAVNLTETQGLARNSTHVRLTLNLSQSMLRNENGTIMYCNNARVPWDAYATTVSGGWVTVLQGLVEVNVSSSAALSCFVYFDPTFNGTEIIPAATGWGYIGASGYSGANYVDLAPADLDCSGTDADGQFTSICSASDNIKLNEWCYFKAPSTTASLILKTGSDDGSALWINNTIAVADNDGPHGVQWRDNSCAGCSGALTVTQGTYQLIEIDFAENTGGEELSNRWDTSAGDNTNGNVIDTECYPTHGDEWALTQSISQVQQVFKEVIPVGSGMPFYTVNPNPRQPSDLACLVNLTEGSACTITWSVNATGPLNSSHIFYVIADPVTYAGSVSSVNSSQITITITDASLVGPTVTLNSPAASFATNNPNVTFNCSATDNFGLVNLTLYANFGGSFISNGTQSVSGAAASAAFTRSLPDGTYLWNCLAEDSDGNGAFAAANRSLTIDTATPAVVQNSPAPAAILFSNTVAFGWTATDNLDTSLLCNLTLDSTIELAGVASANNTLVEQDVTNVAEGTHVWNMTCIDDAGNTATSTTRNFTIQDIPPALYLMTPNNTYFNTDDPSLSFNTTDNNGIENGTVYIDGIANLTRDDISTGIAESFDLVDMPEGQHAWYIRVIDTGGLTNTSETRIFTVDVTPPGMSITYPPDALETATANVTINFTPTDNLAATMSCNITVAGSIASSIASAANGTLQSKAVLFADGVSAWNITCADLAGNANTTVTRTINVSAPPQVTLVSPDDGAAQSSSTVLFQYVPSDNAGITSCSLILNSVVNATNASITNNAASSFTVTQVADGTLTWAINCTDTAGFTGASVVHTLTIDTSSPTVTLHEPSAGATLLGTAHTMNFTAVDFADSVMNCTLNLDGSTAGHVNMTSPNNTIVNVTGTTASEGLHYWYVTCLDDALNEGTSETRNFTTLNPPTVTLQTPANGTLFNTSAVNLTYYLLDTGGVTNTTLVLDGTPYASDTTPINDATNNFTLAGVADGQHTWTVSAKDTDDLVSTADETWTFSIDTAKPALVMHSPTAGATLTTNGVYLNFTVTDNLDTNLLCNVSLNTTASYLFNATNGTLQSILHNLTDGAYSWQVICMDDASNTNASGQVPFLVEAPPQVTLLAPLNGTRTTNTSLLLTYLPFDVFGLENCTAIFDGMQNESSSSILNGQSNSFFLDGIPDGAHAWTMQCYDVSPDFNVYQPDAFDVFVDLTGPVIAIVYPPNGTTFNSNNISFNWTATDFTSTTINCTVRVSDTPSERIGNTSAVSGAMQSKTFNGFADGPHAWNVTCSDDLGNAATSEMYGFQVNQPDLLVNGSSITFNTTNPDLNTEILINATVWNIGGTDANNAIISFWDGYPGSGLFIGNDTVSVTVNNSATASVPWNISTGYHAITVIADPGNAMGELDETNNNATKNISVLWVNITDPANATLTGDNTPQFAVMTQDYTNGSINYTFYVDGTANGQNGPVADGVPFTINLTALADGAHLVFVNVRDQLARAKNSSHVYITIDTTAPVPVFNTQNNSWFNTSTPTINFTVTDAIDATLNWTLYLDGVLNLTGLVTNNTWSNITLSPLANGVYRLTLEGIDDAGNRRNSTALTIYVDQAAPSVTLLAPEDGANSTSQVVFLNYSVTDNMDGNITCALALDSTIVDTRNASNGTLQTYTTSQMAEGMHLWNVTCADGALNQNVSETRSFSVFLAPNVTLISPANGTLTGNASVLFWYTVTDDTGITSCRLILNGAVNQTLASPPVANNATNNFTVGFDTTQVMAWYVSCTDSTGLRIVGTSENLSLTVDRIAPSPYIMTANGTWFATATPNLTVNISDDIDTTPNYTVYVDGSLNSAGTAANGTATNITLASLANGAHTIVLEGADDVGNRANSTPLIVFVDTVAPNITLLYPPNGTNLTTQETELNFTVLDALDSSMVCNLTLDNAILRAAFSVPNGSVSNTSITELAPGSHAWNVTCVDEAGNRGSSTTFLFNVLTPDLIPVNITLNTSTLVEFQNVTISANVSNQGYLEAENVTVQFYVGDPDGGGAQIGSNITLSSLAMNESVVVSRNFTLPIGPFIIFVLADPPLATNGSIQESNETNNEASQSFHVGHYEIVAGDAAGQYLITDASFGVVFAWNVSNSTGSNLFVADADSAIDFSDLAALGYSTSGNLRFDDFAELDGQLNSTNFTDSINATWTTGGSVRSLTDYAVFGSTIANVSIVNSTNTSAFQTGILWDVSDGGTEYNGMQDVIFMTLMNENAAGGYGTYDYELKVPATLRNYRGGTQSVTFYVELK